MKKCMLELKRPPVRAVVMGFSFPHQACYVNKMAKEDMLQELIQQQIM